MLLGTRNYAQNDVRKVVIHYSDWLMQGYVLSSVTASITPATGIQSTVGPITLDPLDITAYVQLNLGPVNESFTLNVVAKDTFGQTVNDQLNVNVILPGAS